MRIFILSDIHIDFIENKQWLAALSGWDYKDDVLILAGDVSHNLHQLQMSLMELKEKFRRLFFVPGNHDLWIREGEQGDSLEKMDTILEFCTGEGIGTRPERVGDKQDAHAVWIVPLLSWYAPEESANALYIFKPGEDASNRMWSDNYFIQWPDHRMMEPDQVFFEMNRKNLMQEFDRPVISISHFLPRQEMMFSRNRVTDQEKIKKYDRHPAFNFSRVAGSRLIEKQIRQIKSQIHVYGHQHINRDRILEQVRYVSHCLGYPEERNRGSVKGIGQGLKLIWDTRTGEVDREQAEKGGGKWAIEEGI